MLDLADLCGNIIGTIFAFLLCLGYQAPVWGAIGLEIRTDFAGQTCAFFAQDLG